jgi:hypothetical protein
MGRTWSVRAKLRLETDASLMSPAVWSNANVPYIRGCYVIHGRDTYVCLHSYRSNAAKTFAENCASGYWALTSLTAVDKPLFTIMGRGTDNLLVKWNASAETISLSDGAHTATSGTFPSLFRPDAIDIVITHDAGGNALLYTRDPLNGTRAAGASSGVGLATSPREVRFGTDATNSTHGEVLVLGCGVWQSTLTPGQVNSVFALPADGFSRLDVTAAPQTQAADAAIATARGRDMLFRFRQSCPLR